MYDNRLLVLLRRLCKKLFELCYEAILKSLASLLGGIVEIKVCVMYLLWRVVGAVCYVAEGLS